MRVKTAPHTKIYSRFVLINVSVDEYSYIGANSNIRNTTIGKFCSIGPNFMCGLAYHPIQGISTSPFFYSTAKQCGSTLSKINKVYEYKDVIIGHDVFIGANVTILGGIKIGNGVVIAAGAVVTKDVPDYAIIGGVPAKVIKYRFSVDVIEKLLDIKWWNFPINKLLEIERNIFDVNRFLDDHVLLNIKS